MKQKIKSMGVNLGALPSNVGMKLKKHQPSSQSGRPGSGYVIQKQTVGDALSAMRLHLERIIGNNAYLTTVLAAAHT